MDLLRRTTQYGSASWRGIKMKLSSYDVALSDPHLGPAQVPV